MFFLLAGGFGIFFCFVSRLAYITGKRVRLITKIWARNPPSGAAFFISRGPLVNPPRILQTTIPMANMEATTRRLPAKRHLGRKRPPITCDFMPKA